MNKEPETILIYDDEQGRPDDFKDELDEGLNKANQSEKFDIRPVKDNDFQNAIKALEQRRINFRKKKDIYPKENSTDAAEEIDNASIFIIDYDLLDNQRKKKEELFTGSLTGEIVAYLVRCFSRCKLIIGLNQYGNNPFDLTLRGDLDSFADLNLGDQQLGNPNLWTSDWKDSEQEFRPWSWPNLSDSIHDFDKRVKEVQEELDKPIREVLSFDPEMFQLLPREIVQFVGKSQGEELFQTTFREFVTKSGNGLRSKDAKDLDYNINDHVLARIGAARISKWLEQLVLPEQDLLVDAPHLISRYPSLIKGDKENIEIWNKTAQLVGHEGLGLHTNVIESYRFGRDDKAHWISRPVWFWDKLRECENIKEVTEPWLTATPDWVFCEDTSCFHNQMDCKEFFADIASPFTRRFVRNFDGVDYQPRVRFSL